MASLIRHGLEESLLACPNWIYMERFSVLYCFWYTNRKKKGERRKKREERRKKKEERREKKEERRKKKEERRKKKEERRKKKEERRKKKEDVCIGEGNREEIEKAR